jgi:5-(aminomethyl)-3-furanmethanol phosphate kinase
MGSDAWTVVKVGGSLYELPDLRERLRGFLDAVDGNILLIPGGAATADAIRTLDRVHHLGEEQSHWLAIQTLSINARFLQTLLREARLLQWASDAHAESRLRILDALPFFEEDERAPEHLPHRWDVTSDSLAVRAAVLVGARDLMLLKSIDWHSSDWTAAAENGIVDRYFPQALQQAPTTLQVRVVNLRKQASP